MIIKVLLFIILAYILFELIEHAVLPLVWLILKKKKRAVTGPSGLIGEVGEVKEWSGKEGRIFVHGELWRAESEELLSASDKAVIQNVQRLTLTVKPHKNDDL